MAEGSSGPNGTHWLVTYKDDAGSTTTARFPLGTKTDSDFSAAVTALRAAYPTLRTWSGDAAATNIGWPTMTAAQKDAATRETIRRLGVFLDRFGDLLLALNADA